ncbi:hypothetical protein MTR67_044577 [Solanum verrucosum]|uniref:Tf2-1-like SH3-like domain-containing protein n=1 Tax=Solanum verrucosum TaxID=315347 RepID=A0AAF0URT6_SOLVR|nr:hypothetical protein MTR67_044577 [Solanum verrucosum]
MLRLGATLGRDSMPKTRYDHEGSPDVVTDILKAFHFYVDMDSEIPTLESVLIVNEFQEVFPDYLPGIPPERCVIIQNNSESSLVSDVQANQDLDPVLVDLKNPVSEKPIEAFSHKGDGVLQYQAYEWCDEIKKKGKLTPRYVGPYHILRRIGKVAYELELPNDFELVHPVFYVSLLKKCIGDSTSIVLLESLGVKESLLHEEVPVEIQHHQVQNLRKKGIVSMKVLWRNQQVESATWEAKADMMSKYPYVFPLAPTQA